MTTSIAVVIVHMSNLNNSKILCYSIAVNVFFKDSKRKCWDLYSMFGKCITAVTTSHKLQSMAHNSKITPILLTPLPPPDIRYRKDGRKQ